MNPEQVEQLHNIVHMIARYIMVAVIGANVIMAAKFDGKEKPNSRYYDFSNTVGVNILFVLLLAAGGFWG